MSTGGSHGRGRHMNTVGIVGAGVIGTAIAAACVAAGRTVRITDRDPERLGRVAHGERVDDLTGLAGSDVVVEAITEDLLAKRELLAALTAPGGSAAGSCLLLTTTSAFTVTELAADLPDPRRLAGMHVIPTVAGIRLAEVAPGAHTAADAIAATKEFATGLGWTPLVVGDRPGRLTRRLLMPFVNQVVQAFDDGLASPADIDRVAELGLGHRRGPLAVLDTAGLADHLAATRATHAAVHDPALAPPPLLARLVAAGGEAHFRTPHDAVPHDARNGATQP
jgi:3-hydroxybutyryl-CoA dehydrogenase